MSGTEGTETEEEQITAITRLAEERQKEVKKKERQKQERGLLCGADSSPVLEKQQGASESQQEPGSMIWSSVSTTELQYTALSCRYRDAGKNSHRSLEHVKQLLYPKHIFSNEGI